MNRRVRVKPSKGQSLAGFIAGLLFCVLGVVVVIPTFGFFGIIWTLFAVIITVTNAINVWSKKGVATHEITIDSDGANSDDAASIENRLTELRQLYDKGILTTEEYNLKRKQIIDTI